MAAYGKILAYGWIGWTLVRFYPHAPIHTTPLQLHMCMCICMWHVHVCM
jgi:hypothetical protein